MIAELAKSVTRLVIAASVIAKTAANPVEKSFAKSAILATAASAIAKRAASHAASVIAKTAANPAEKSFAKFVIRYLVNVTNAAAMIVSRTENAESAMNVIRIKAAKAVKNAAVKNVSLLTVNAAIKINAKTANQQS